MASKKISYNDLKNTDNTQLKTALSGKRVVSKSTNNTNINIASIAEDPKGDFQDIFPFDENAARTIADSIEAHGYDKTQVIHLAKILEEPETKDSPIRIDGRHRVEACRMAHIEEIPAYIHTFETRQQALIYAYELQLNRRNLEPYQKLDAMAKLDQLKNPGKKTDTKEPVGKSAEEVADMLGVSTRTAERMRNIINNGDEETVEKVKKGEISISKADKIINDKKPSKKTKKKNDEEDISDSLEDNTGDPKGVFIGDHSDGIERPNNRLSPEEDNERTQERKKAYDDGFAEGFEKALIFVLFETLNGKTPKEIYNDEKLKDLSPSVITKFELPEGAEDAINSL